MGSYTQQAAKADFSTLSPAWSVRAKRHGRETRRATSTEAPGRAFAQRHFERHQLARVLRPARQDRGDDQIAQFDDRYAGTANVGRDRALKEFVLETRAREHHPSRGPRAHGFTGDHEVIA